MSELKPGRYQHYKGGLYQFISLAKSSETLEDLVVYKPLYKCEFGDILWVRPKAEFLGTVEVDGKTVPRFRFVG